MLNFENIGEKFVKVVNSQSGKSCRKSLINAMTFMFWVMEVI